MLARLGAWISRIFRTGAPDPFVLAVLLTLLTLAMGVGLMGRTPAQMGAYWQGGMWALLSFAMQMCLILVTGHALASAPPVARALGALSAVPRTPRQAVWLTSFVAIGCSLLNWGLGLIVGSILARDVARAMRARGVRVSPALLAAAGFTCMMTWHGGLSGSAPLKVASLKDQVELLGPELGARIGAIPSSETIFSPMNLTVTLGLWAFVPLFMALMCPRLPTSADEGEPAIELHDERTEPMAPEAPGQRRSAADWVNTSPVFAWAIALPALWLVYRHFVPASGAGAGGSLSFDVMNLLFLALGLLLHASPARYVRAIEQATRGCAGIIIQFPLYAGIVAMLDKSGLGAAMSRWFVDVAGRSEGGLAVGTFLSAGLVNVFVPSGGGQWAVQGRIALQAAADSGASPGKMVMAVAYGDQWTNMIQFFWALPLTGITGVRAQDALGYTAVTLLVTGPLFALALVVF